jgi:DMSO/TMAO reductase YedYZ molybdopterin-dependent catalytic subunit
VARRHDSERRENALHGRERARTRSIEVRSATGYSRRFGASDIEGIVLATHLDGVPIPPEHGAPARLVAPGRRGYWWVKWVTAVEPSSVPAWLQSPFPLT